MITLKQIKSFRLGTALQIPVLRKAAQTCRRSCLSPAQPQESRASPGECNLWTRREPRRPLPGPGGPRSCKSCRQPGGPASAAPACPVRGRSAPCSAQPGPGRSLPAAQELPQAVGFAFQQHETGGKLRLPVSKAEHVKNPAPAHSGQEGRRPFYSFVQTLLSPHRIKISAKCLD